MDIVIIANFCMDFTETDNGRFSYIANALCKDNEVEIITSRFYHITKKQRGVLEEHPYKITLLDEPGYKKNISIRRFYSHYIWGQNVKKYLKKRKKPDVIYCAVPSLTAPYYTSKYCAKNKIRFVIDIQDLWPEAFQMVFNIPILSAIIFAPFKWIENEIYRCANDIVAVSQTYVDRALSVNIKCKSGYSVFLGTDIDTFDKNSDKEAVLTKKEGDIWLVYCGTLGSSYDLSCVIEAIKDAGIDYLKFIVMGDGPHMKKFINLAQKSNVDAIFTGRLPYDEMCAMLSECDIAINPIMIGASQSIINKHADYAMAGLPVISSQDRGEYSRLLETYRCGVNCDPGNVLEVRQAIIELTKNKQKRIEYGKNSRRLAEEKFDRQKTYKTILNVIQQR